jgi:hypothetical protein
MKDCLGHDDGVWLDCSEVPCLLAVATPTDRLRSCARDNLHRYPEITETMETGSAVGWTLGVMELVHDDPEPWAAAQAEERVRLRSFRLRSDLREYMEQQGPAAGGP